MKGIGAVITNSIKNNLRSRTLLILFVATTVLAAFAVAFSIALIDIAPTVEEGSADIRSDLESSLGLVMYATCFLVIAESVGVFAISSLTREKSRGSVESLLATPLKPKGIWFAKSLAAFLPGLVLGEIFTAIALVALNYTYIVPEIGFLITPPIVVSSFIVAPIVALCLSLLVHLIGLTGSPGSSNTIFICFLLILLLLPYFLRAIDALAPTTWLFTLINLGIAALIGVIIAFPYPRLTEERIVLSSRGGEV
jgi:ABC-type Na+ efflux pump permease subunit